MYVINFIKIAKRINFSSNTNLLTFYTRICVQILEKIIFEIVQFGGYEILGRRNFRRSFSTINHNLHFNLPENIINLKLNRLRDLLHRSIDKETGDRKPVEYSTLDGSNYSPRRTPCARARKDGWDGEERKVESRRIEDRAIVWRETRVSTGHDPRPRQGSRGLCLRPRSHRTAPVMHLAIDFLLALVALSLSLSLSLHFVECGTPNESKHENIAFTLPLRAVLQV